MNNLDFFKAGWINEKNTTSDIFKSVIIHPLEPGAKVDCKSQREMMVRILAHLQDMETILVHTFCEETQEYFFTDNHDAAARVGILWDSVMQKLNQCTLNDWENQQVQLHAEGEPIVTLSRTSMVWFLFFDIMYLRGKLTSVGQPVLN